MILQTKDILHPLNILGSTPGVTQVFSYYNAAGITTLQIEWSGRVLILEDSGHSQLGYYQNGYMNEIIYGVGVPAETYYLDCTNVTHLVINGEHRV